MRASSVVPLGDLPGDRPAGMAAHAAAGLGVLSGAALGAMYALEVPRGGPYRFGAVNDFAGGLFFAATIPVIVQVHRRVGDGPWSRTAETAVITSSAAAAVSGVLLAFHRIPFKPSTAISIAGIAGQAVWAAVTHHKLLRGPGYPRGLARAGRAIGCGMLAGLPLAAAGFAVPRLPVLKWAMWGIGGTLGAASYLAWPVWFGACGRQLRGLSGTQQATTFGATQPATPGP
ncbi:MAG: hypothetical protein WCF12_08005 [Propionicimonas sp.]